MDGQMQNSAAGYGCFLIIPLKYDKDSFEKAKLEQVGESIPVTTMDLNENVKAMFSPEDEMAAGTGYAIPRDPLTAKITDGKDGEIIRNFRAVDDNGKFTFELSGSWIYIFHTRVAFLCLNLSFDRIETLQAICNPGWAYNPAEFFWSDPAGE